MSHALEAIAYCLFDGKVDQKSKFETDLYNDLVEQLNNLYFLVSGWKKILPFAWIYLKTFGQITESLCNHFFWTFTEEDFKNALACFVFEYNEKDNRVKDLGRFSNWYQWSISRTQCSLTSVYHQLFWRPISVQNIKMRFHKFLHGEFDGSIKDWAEKIFSKVNIICNILYVCYES